MWRVFAAFAILLCLGVIAKAQTTSVSGQVVDSSSQQWKNGTYQFTFVLSPVNPFGPYRQGGQPFNTGQVISGSLDGTGSFSGVAVPDNTTIFPSGSAWIFQACPAATAPCYTTKVTISGASQTITSAINPPAIVVNLSNPPLNPAAYTDSEISGARQGSNYFNLSDNTLHICQLPLCSWQSLGSPGSILGLNNPFTGNNSFSGTSALNGGGNFAGTWTGAPSLSGLWSFNAGVTGTGTIGTLGLGSTALGANNTWAGTNSFSTIQCKNLENTRCVDSTNSAGWSGSDIGGWINSAYADCPSSIGMCLIQLAPNPSGTSYAFSTPIAFTTAGKCPRLDLGGASINYTPTTATTAITFNCGPSSGANFNLAHGVTNGTLTNNGCVLATTCGVSSATGIALGANAAPGPQFTNLGIGGFSVGFSAPGASGGMWGAVLNNVTIASNATGLTCSNPYENMNITGGRIITNATGINNQGGCDLYIRGVSIDSNTTVGINNSGLTVCDNCHFENANGSGGGLTTHYISGSGITNIIGGQALDDQTTGNTDFWFSCSGASPIMFVDGLTLVSGGRTATSVFSATSPCNLYGSYNNFSQATLTTAYTGTGTFNLVAIDNNQSHVVTSIRATAGDITTFKANSGISGTWGISINGAGSNQIVYAKLGGDTLQGNTGDTASQRLPAITGTLGEIFQCGTIAAGGACSNASTTIEHCISGIATLSAGTSTITGISPAFTSSSTFYVTTNDITTIANPSKGVPASGSSITFTGTGTDNIQFIACGG